MAHIPADPSSWPPRRSVLFVPAANARALDKAAGLPADALILDLEDSVAEAQRGQAEAALRDWGGRRPFAREWAVRTRALAEPGGDDDLALAAAVRPDAVLLPKVDGPGEIAQAAERLGPAGARPALWTMIESPRGVLAAPAIAEAVAAANGGRPAGCLIVGPNDLAKSTGVSMEGAGGVSGRAAMRPWFMAAVLAARAHGLAVLDGVYNAFRDEAGFAAECGEALALGFDGKTLIHPAQIAPANAAFSPPADALSRARAILAAFVAPGAAGRGAIQIDGEMVERLHLDSARRLLAWADRLDGEREIST